MRAEHRAFVEGWLARRGGGPPRLLAAEALDAVWSRAQRSLSELALASLGRCALEAATRERPGLSAARVGPDGFDLRALPDDELLPALSALLVEMLALVEETSGRILAPALMAELLRVGGRRTPAHGVTPIAGG